MANNTGVFFNINDNDGIPLVGVSTDGRVLINHLYGNCLIGSTSSTGTVSQPLQVTGGAYVSGNLGVGVTNPTQALDVNGGRIFHKLSGINTVEFGYGAGSGDLDIYGLYVPPGKSFAVYSNGTFAYEVEGSNILINSSSATGTASQPLQVTGGSYVSGSVGIGITNPQARLHLYDVSGSAAWRLRIGTNVSDGAGFYQRSNGNFEVILRDASNNNNYILGADGNLALRPTSNVLVNTETPTGTASQPLQVNGGAHFSGLVGIGTTNPQVKLNVIGDGNFTGVVTATSFFGSGANLTGISSSKSRVAISASTGSIGAGSTVNLNIQGYKTYSLLKVGITSAAWVVLYTNSTSRTNDQTRNYLTDPLPGSGVIAEVRTTSSGISTFIMSPGIIGWNDDSPTSNTIYARVTNNESSSANITVNLTVLQLED